MKERPTITIIRPEVRRTDSGSNGSGPGSNEAQVHKKNNNAIIKQSSDSIRCNGDGATTFSPPSAACALYRSQFSRNSGDNDGGQTACARVTERLRGSGSHTTSTATLPVAAALTTTTTTISSTTTTAPAHITAGATESPSRLGSPSKPPHFPSAYRDGNPLWPHYDVSRSAKPPLTPGLGRAKAAVADIRDVRRAPSMPTLSAENTFEAYSEAGDTIAAATTPTSDGGRSRSPSVSSFTLKRSARFATLSRPLRHSLGASRKSSHYSCPAGYELDADGEKVLLEAAPQQQQGMSCCQAWSKHHRQLAASDPHLFRHNCSDDCGRGSTTSDLAVGCTGSSLLEGEQEEKRTVAGDSASAISQESPPIKWYRSWSVLIASLLIQMVVMGLGNTAGVYQNYYLNYHFTNVPATELNWISTLTTLTPYVFTWLSVLVNNRLGPRVACGIGTCVCSVALFLASFSKEPWHFVLTQGLLFGIGGAFYYVPTFILPTQYFRSNTGLVLGIAASGNNIGGMWLSPVVEHLLVKYNVQWALRINCFVVVVIGALCTPLMRRRPGTCASSSRDELNTPWYRDFSFAVFRDVRFVMMFLIAVLAPWAYFGPLSYTPSSADVLGFGDSAASTLATVFNACGVVGQISSGFLVDIIGPINVTVISLAMCSISILAIWLPARHFSLFIVFSVFIGLFSGNYDNTLPSISGNIFGEDRTAGLMGFLSIGVGIGTLSGIAGQAHIYDAIDKRGIFHVSILFCGVAAIIAFFFAVVLWTFQFSSQKRKGRRLRVAAAPPPSAIVSMSIPHAKDFLI